MLSRRRGFELNQIYEDYNNRINSYNELLESKGPLDFVNKFNEIFYLKIIEIAKIKNKNNYNISKQLIKHFK